MLRPIPGINPAAQGWSCRVCFLLILITVLLYWPVHTFQFIYDDDQYLSINPNVQNGLTVKSIGWAFTTGYACNWHPITWLSHLLDISLFGFHAGAHHVTNLIFHIANTLLLFFFLRRTTGALWRSAFVAALFAWHPLHVESVAWVAERKDVLSGFFFMLALLAYARAKLSTPHSSLFTQNWLALVFFALGLMSKPMVVTLPLVLLLLDYWQLGKNAEIRNQKSEIKGLVIEKIPFFVLTAVSCVITILAQKRGGAMQPLTNLSLGDRFSNAIVSYARYLGKLFWPVDLSIIYPYSRNLPMVEVVSAALLLLAVFFVVARLAKSHPPIVVGWLWFFVTLVPVIGLLQVGDQAMADRYTYIPSIGLFILIAWEVPRLFSADDGKFQPVLVFSAALILGACLLTTGHQLRYWQNSVKLFSHAIRVTENNGIAECNLGLALAAQGRTNEAVLHEQRAIEINPEYAEAQNNLGFLFEGQGKWDEASRHLAAALKATPKFDQPYYNLGLISIHEGRLDEAISRFRSAIAINPRYDKAIVNLGIALAQQGRLEDAISQYRQALVIAPNNPYAHNALGRALEGRNQLVDAAAEYSAAISCQPDFAAAHENLGVVLAAAGRFQESEDQFAQALRLQPVSASIHFNLGNALLRQNKLREAVNHYSEAARIDPDYLEAHYNLALVLAQLGQTSDAIEHFRVVLRLNPKDDRARDKLARLLKEKNGHPVSPSGKDQ